MNERAEIHDLGYAAYTGPRAPVSRRFLAIARNVFAVAWKSRWVKIPFLVAVGTTVASAVIMWVLRLKLAEEVRVRGGDFIPKAEDIVFHAVQFYEMSAFLLATVVACAAIADDLRLGAFQFYFSRPIRPRDYIGGKLLGLGLVIGVPMFAGPLVLAVVRLILADSMAQAWQLITIVPRAIALGVVGTAAFVLPAAGLGALLQKRQPAQALYAVYVVLISGAAYGMSVPLRFPMLRLVSILNDVTLVGRAIFGLPVDSHWDPSAGAAAAALAVLCGAGLALVIWRVRGAETAGLGGG
jgi:hypothetical protein